MLDVGMLTKRWYKLWNRSIRRKWKRDFFTLKTKQNVLIVFVLYFIVVGFFFLLFDFWKVTCWFEVLRFVCFLTFTFDIHPNNLKCGQLKNLLQLLFLKKILFKIFLEELVWMLWFCEALLFVVQRMKLWHSSVTWEIFDLDSNLIGLHKCINVVS